ncbi:MAG: hypothetical protein ACFBSC_00440 [Microcoleaceae cyanobacterium]
MADRKRLKSRHHNLKNEKTASIRGQEKEDSMADVLQAFVDPYINPDKGYDFDRIRTLLHIATFAWNVSFLTRAEQRQAADEYFEAAFNGKGEKEKFRVVFGQMIKRKKLFFSKHHEIILDYELVETGEGYVLTVNWVEK